MTEQEEAAIPSGEAAQPGTTPGESAPERARNSGFLALMKSKRVGECSLLAVCLVLLYLFWIREMRFFLVPSASMEPTLLVGDQLVTLSGKEYRRGDIVVLEDPEEAGGQLVKRIAGLGGERVHVQGGALRINGEYVSEPYIAEPMRYEMEGEVTVPEGHFFVLGDNRNNSDDSHTRGATIPASDVIGKVRFIYYPYARFGPVRGYPAFPLAESGKEAAASPD